MTERAATGNDDATALSFAAGTHLLMYAVAWSLDAEKANQADSCRSFHLRLERS